MRIIVKLYHQVLKLMEKFGIGDEKKGDDAASIASGSGTAHAAPASAAPVTPSFLLQMKVMEKQSSAG